MMMHALSMFHEHGLIMNASPTTSKTVLILLLAVPSGCQATKRNSEGEGDQAVRSRAELVDVITATSSSCDNEICEYREDSATRTNAFLDLLKLEGEGAGSDTLIVLCGPDLPLLDFADASFVGESLRRLDLRASSFRGATFSNADLSGSSLGCSNLSGAKFLQSTLVRSDFSDTNLDNSVFTKATAHFANFSKSSMKFASLSNADLSNSKLTELTMMSVDLSHANLQNVDLSGSHLISSDLTGANLRHAKLEDTLCLGIEWSGAICPDGRLATQAEGCVCGYDSFGQGSPVPVDGWQSCHKHLGDGLPHNKE
jgi:uncharacterized protein YjbI with pentapeptide repeats